VPRPAPTIRLFVAATIACGTAPDAFAQDRATGKWYVAADLGSSSIGVSQYNFATPVTPRDSRSNTFRVRAGYQFVEYFALEAGYADLGDYQANVRVDCASAPSQPCIGDYRSEIKLRAVMINAAGVLPIGARFTVRGNIGMGLRVKETHQFPENAQDYELSANELMPFFGFGAGVAITPKLEVIAEWNKFAGQAEGYGDGVSKPGELGDEADVEAFSLGVRFRF
jgi:OmpA-OmpF porin, OOP family